MHQASSKSIISHYMLKYKSCSTLRTQNNEDNEVIHKKLVSYTYDDQVIIRHTGNLIKLAETFNYSYCNANMQLNLLYMLSS